MPRFNEKYAKIAFDILGTPGPLRKVKKTKEQKKIDERLVFEETIRVR